MTWESIIIAIIVGAIIAYCYKKWNDENKECPTCRGEGSIKRK